MFKWTYVLIDFLLWGEVFEKQFKREKDSARFIPAGEILYFDQWVRVVHDTIVPHKKWFTMTVQKPTVLGAILFWIGYKWYEKNNR